MLFLLFVYYLVRGGFIDANPIPSIYNRSLAENHCSDLTHCRTIWSIIWSSLVTILSCTWVAVHPNIPSPKKRKANSWIEGCILNPLLSFADHRLPLLVCTLLVPEYVLAWAIRQYLSARKLAKENKDRQWSMTHGFFITMGGFHLFEHSYNNDGRCISQEDDKPLHPLGASDLLDYAESIVMPTKVEIKDRGKSDWLARSFALLQTSWFVAQCIARAIEHLPVTHLEIVTLAYVIVNFIIYIFWWNKPLNVNRPIRVFRRSEPRETQPQANEPNSEARKPTWKAIDNGLKTILRLIVIGEEEHVDLSREDRVPRFWANSSDDDAGIADLVVLGVGVCFGAIHCTAWAFSFPTHTELLMWQISSVAITALPIYIALMFLLGVWMGYMDFDQFGVIFLYVGPVIGGILYSIARATTLVLAFTSLRDLPPGAYEVVHWTTFIPHV